MLTKLITTPILKGKAKTLMLLFSLILLCTTILASCGGPGACVGSGGDVLSSPVCKDGWTRDECQEWDDMEINDADWNFRSGRTCERLGYTERCSDGSYRLPGDC
ncbi:MAG: hypothetical protein GTO14_13715 [Anaerolineales bacterium]|nr:hypothetical protein [Anaerolineales bacterium]